NLLRGHLKRLGEVGAPCDVDDLHEHFASAVPIESDFIPSRFRAQSASAPAIQNRSVRVGARKRGIPAETVVPICAVAKEDIIVVDAGVALDIKNSIRG